MGEEASLCMPRLPTSGYKTRAGGASKVRRLPRESEVSGKKDKREGSAVCGARGHALFELNDKFQNDPSYAVGFDEKAACASTSVMGVRKARS
jgi:hypothetical protein